MNEIMLSPCDVIIKIEQNSSDMNEIILAPCDAGYVQSCTGCIIRLTLLIHCLCFIAQYFQLGAKLSKLEKYSKYYSKYVEYKIVLAFFENILQLFLVCPKMCYKNLTANYSLSHCFKKIMGNHLTTVFTC
jgi:hypothetical protein